MLFSNFSLKRLQNLIFLMFQFLEGDITNIEDAVVDETTMDSGPIDNLRGLDVMRRVAPKYSAFRQFYTENSTKNDVAGFKQEQNGFNFGNFFKLKKNK